MKAMIKPKPRDTTPEEQPREASFKCLSIFDGCTIELHDGATVTDAAYWQIVAAEAERRNALQTMTKDGLTIEQRAAHASHALKRQEQLIAAIEEVLPEMRAEWAAAEGEARRVWLERGKAVRALAEELANL